MDSIWDRFTVASLWLKTFIIGTTTIIVGASFCGLILTHNRELNFYHAIKFLLFANSKVNEYGNYSAVFYMVFQFLLAIWQSFFLLHVLTYSRSFRFSKFLVLYDKPFSERYADAEYLVFRLMNSGSSDLYNVTIKATLRVFSTDDRSIDHYTCHVVNEHIPVLKRFMPFRIHIATGLIHIAGQSSHSLVAAYLLPNSDLQRKDGKPVISLSHNASVREDYSFAFIIHVEGRAPKADRTRSFAHEYTFDHIRRGRFAPIEFRRIQGRLLRYTPYKFFSRPDVKLNFDRVTAS